jgi:hypothetical protein
MADIIPFGTPNQAGNQGQTRESGFTPHEFRRLDGLFLRAASAKAIAERTVNVTFEQKEAEFGYYKKQPCISDIFHQAGRPSNHDV